MQTEIVCTLGPASDSEAVLSALLEAGMSVARLNFSHGDHAEHRERADRVRRAAQVTGRPVQLIQDLQGPKIRTLHVPLTELHPGDRVLLGAAAGAGLLAISHPEVLAGVAPGQRIYLDDGAIELEAVDRTAAGVQCLVLIGGSIEGNQGVAFPETVLALPPLTEKDVADAAVGRDIGFEWVALSFVQRWEDIEALRPHIRPESRVIAKIETRAALDDLTSIVAGVDAAMIARGDLGVAIPRARVPIVQKDIIQTCRQQGTGSIVATEMFLSMVRNAHPTRAEVADVATAVLDGCNAVMLSEETAIGAYPVRAVEEMRQVIETVESSDYYLWREG